MSDYQILTVEQTAGGGLALRRKDADEVVSPGASPVKASASGFPLTIPDAAEGRRFESVRIPFGPAQAGVGDPSPDNVRPLSPRIPVLYRCGANLYTGEGDTANTGYDASGNIGPSTGGARITDHIPVSGEDEIVLLVWGDVVTATARPIRAGAYDADGNMLNGGALICNYSTCVGSYTARIALPAGTATVRVSLYGLWNLGVYAGSTAESFTMDAPEEAGDVWGGVWDPVTGTLTVDRISRTLADLQWIYMSNYNYFTVRPGSIPNLKKPALNMDVLDGLLCSAYKSGSATDTGSGAVNNTVGVDTTGALRIRDESYSDVTGWLAAMGGERVVIPIEEPVTYHLTPAKIEALDGVNTLFSDAWESGADCDVAAEYVKDTAAAIEEGDASTRAMIAEASGESASRSLAVGEFVSVGAALYRVTAAVGQGETLVPGTNVAETTVGAELTGTAGELAAHETDAGEELRILAEIADRTYAGRNLTAVFASEIAQSGGDPWAWIKGRITAGNYKGIHVGDWIPYTDTSAAPKTRNARIIGIDTYRQYGSPAVGHHIDFWGGLWTPKKPINKDNYNNGTSESEHPWLASDAYLYANSLAGKVPSETTANPALVDVDYTADGIWYFLPDTLKAQIKPKRLYLEKRYTAGELLTESPAGGWADLGKIWFPAEYEVFGAPVWGGDQYAVSGSAVQYPFFMGNMNRLAFGRSDWWLLTPRSGNSTTWCYVNGNGVATSYHGTSVTSIAAPVCFRIAQ